MSINEWLAFVGLCLVIIFVIAPMAYWSVKDE